MRNWLWLAGGALLGTALGQQRPAPTPPPPPVPEAPPDLEAERQRLAELTEQAQARLGEIAGLSREAALQQLLEEVRIEQRLQLQQVAQQEWERLASSRIAEAMQRLVVPTVQELSITTLSLPSDDYKGRIIGKEGRNLRQFESLTGVDVLIDDAPGSVALSCFDPARREVAAQALRELLEDGRFQPGRIEEAVRRAQAQLPKILRERAQQALQELGMRGMHAELVTALGALSLRSSYRQNILDHSVEVAWLCGQLSADLGGDVEVARRAGLLHDVGKGLVGESGPHAVLGAKLCRRLGESPAVCHAVEAHHEDVPQQSLEATLVQVADAISAARPGARRENAQFYLERLQTMEKLASQIPGVEDCHVVQAGREVRVFVRSEVVDDARCVEMADTLTRSIQESMRTPGPVRVKVIRRFEAVGQVR